MSVSQIDAVRWDSTHPADGARGAVSAAVLPVYLAALTGDDSWRQETVQRLRELAASWAATTRDLDVLLGAAQSVSGDLVDAILEGRCPAGPLGKAGALSAISRLGTKVIVELTRGFQAGRPGRRPSQSVARNCAVVVVRGAPKAVNAVRALLLRQGAVPVVPTLRPEGEQMLLPAPDIRHAMTSCRKALDATGVAVWFSVHWQQGDIGQQDWELVGDMLAVVVALRLGPGVYGINDVLVEYAAARNPVIAESLRELIGPIMAQPMLVQTLEALLDADGNRAKAAEKLIIHRSTIDYRLRRIKELTGHSPYTVASLAVLSTALAMYNLANPRTDDAHVSA